MPSTLYKTVGVDLDTLYEPIMLGDPLAAATGYKVLGADLNTLYAPASVGTASTAITGLKQAGVEISPRFAARNSRVGGGDGGGGCVDVSMFLDYNFQAADVYPGAVIECVSYAPLGMHYRCVEKCPVTMQMCMRLFTAGGAEWQGSISTPFDTKDGSSLFLPDLLGQLVVTNKEGVITWERVVELRDVGLRPVANIYVADGNYFAGHDPGYRVGSHNGDKT